MQIQLQNLCDEHLDNYFDLNKPSRIWHTLNGPYYPKESEQELRQRIESMRELLREHKQLPNKKMIVDIHTNTLLGEVSWYWKSIETNWMEVGIVIFDEMQWGKGIATIALTKWVDYLFNEKADLVRLGLTTFSANTGMMCVSEKIGMQCEARYRKARIVNGEYYDSISYGVLREEWKKSKEA